MIEVIHYQHQSTEKPLVANISNYYDEVRKLLPGLPDTMQIYFSDYGIIPEYGIGGFAYSPTIITISIDPDFEDKAQQIKDIRPTVFHEAFHQSQSFTGASPPYSAILNAIYEGMATVFEREYADSPQPYGDYRQLSERTLKTWVNELAKISAQEFAEEHMYEAWKFYHTNYKERWIAYRVGTWLTDQVLARYKLTILDLSTRTAADVLALYER